jgi:hypothetical protein
MVDEDDRFNLVFAALVQVENGCSADRTCPVCDVEVDAVERELHVVLPRSYRAFLRWCGTGRVGTLLCLGCLTTISGEMSF